MNIKIIFLLCLLITAPTLIFAHGGGHEEKDNLGEETPVLKDSIYVVDSEKHTEPSIISDDPLDSSLSSTDILSGKDLLTGMEMTSGEPMVRFEDEIDPKRKHSQHEEQNQHVEKATHKWVSLHAKGHAVAVGITIISGLVFAGLSFFRIGEGSSKKPS